MKFYSFVLVQRGHYQILSEDETVIANVKQRFVWARTYKEVHFPLNKKLGFNPKGKIWTSGWKVIWEEGTPEVFKNLPAINDKYNFINFPGPYKVLQRR